MRLSSDSLYHYKSQFDVFKLVLKHGMRHGMWQEKHPYKDTIQYNYIVCFCDILTEQSAYHRQCYGNFAIALNKEWAIRNGISPVRYVHERSPGTDPDYLEFKSRMRLIMSKSEMKASTIALDALISCLAEPIAKGFKFPVFGLMDKGSLIFLSEMEKWESKVMALASLQDDNGQLYRESIMAMFEKINMLMRELECRDSFLRIYKDDFSHPISGMHKGKILYDEREWRSVKFLSNKDEEKEPGINKKCFDQGFLPPELNLKFCKDDVSEIRVSDYSSAKEVEELSKDQTSQIYGIDCNKIKTW